MGRLTDPLLEAVTKSRRSARDISICAVRHSSAVRNLKRGMDLRLSTVEALCRELGLEIYIGPPRWSTIRELKEKLLTPEEQATITPELEQAMEEAVAHRHDEIWREAAENLDKALRKAKEAAEAISGELSPSPNPVPVEIARALNLPPDCTVEQALAAMGETLAKIERQRHADDETTGTSDEYVPVSDVDGFEFLLFSIRRQALQPWAAAERLMGILASSALLTTLEPAVPEGNWVVMDTSYSQPLQNGLFVTMDPDLGWEGFAIERVNRVSEEWLLFSDSPGRKPRLLGKNIRLFGRVAWHGPSDSRDIRGEFEHLKNLVNYSTEEWAKRHEANVAAKTAQESPAARRRVGSKK